MRLTSAADRARRGISGALHSQSALARPNPRLRGWALGPVRRLKVLILRSRAVVACEPGQVREEAALSDTDHAPRGSRRGAVRRRERSELNNNDGCTVHLLPLDVEISAPGANSTLIVLLMDGEGGFRAVRQHQV